VNLYDKNIKYEASICTMVMVKRKTSHIGLFFVFVVVTFFLLSTNTTYKGIPSAYAETNAAMFATIAASNGSSSSSNHNTVTNNAIATNAPTNANTFTANNTTQGLQIKTNINYFDSSSGYLVYPSSTTTGKKLPAVIMVHEWWGINDNIRSMANTLAKQGYVVLAVDLFKGQSATNANDAMQLIKIVSDNPGQAISNLQSAVKYVSSLPFVDSSKLAVIGWCFGGGQALQLALHSEQHPLAATILYYGTPLVTDKQQLSNIKWPVLGIFGDKDQAIPLSNIQQFKAALDSIGVPNEINIYKGVGHAFANPSGANYAPNETINAWQKTLAFLMKYL
jgi:carboxymethylenebutenolidase